MSNTFGSVCEWLNWLISSVECFTWLLDNRLISADLISGTGNFSKSIDHFVNAMVSRSNDEGSNFGQVRETLTPRQANELNEISCTALVRIFTLVVALAEKSSDNFSESFVQKFGERSFWSLVFLSLVVPALLGFDVRKDEIEAGLKSTISRYELCSCLFFCCTTSLPLASTRWVRLTLSSLCPLF